MTNRGELLLHNNRLMHRLGFRLSPIFAPSFLFLPSVSQFLVGNFVVIDPRGQAPMGLPMLGRAILLLEISTLVALNLAAVNGEPSPYSLPPSWFW
jgi:hypothetical protein